MHKVAILLHRDSAVFELGCAVELFGLPRPEYANWYDSDVVSFDDGPFALTAGLNLNARKVRSLDAYTTLVVSSWPSREYEVPRNLASAVHKFYRQGKRILSFCTGAFLLAQLGLLEGRRATTHWRYADIFKARFPGTAFAHDVLYVYDGTLGCSAGSAASLDLGIEVIRQDFGHHIANQVARRLVLSAHRKGGQSQFVETPVQATPNQFASALDWAIRNLARRIDIDEFARKAAMSRRTFDRKFRSTFNLTPHVWLVMQRLNLAKQLLETNGGNIDWIAAASGFDNAMLLRHHFRKVLGLSPTRYREQFFSAQRPRGVAGADVVPAHRRGRGRACREN